MYINAWCIIYSIMCVTAFDKAQLCVNSIFKHFYIVKTSFPVCRNGPRSSAGTTELQDQGCAWWFESTEQRWRRKESLQLGSFLLDFANPKSPAFWVVTGYHGYFPVFGSCARAWQGSFLPPDIAPFRGVWEEAQCRNNRAPLQLQAAPIRLQGGLPEVQVIIDELSLSLSGQYSCRDPILCPQWKTTP